MTNGISGNIATNQQSLFTAQSQQQSSQSQQVANSPAANSSEDSSGNVQQQAQVSVLKDSLETQAENTQKLIESSVGIGQNVDTLA